MPIGVILCVGAVFTGGIIGAVLKDHISEDLKVKLTMVFGICAMTLGINSVIKLEQLPAVILSVIGGTAIGVLLRLEDHLKSFLSKSLSKTVKDEETLSSLVTVIVLFSASANGIYGALDAGFSGDHSILISKSIMDLFTAMIFACNLGKVTALISIPQAVVLFALYYLSGVLYPYLSPTMIADFKGCGGVLLLATGFRVMKVKEFPLVDMIPALVIVMPISAFWSSLF